MSTDNSLLIPRSVNNNFLSKTQKINVNKSTIGKNIIDSYLILKNADKNLPASKLSELFTENLKSNLKYLFENKFNNFYELLKQTKSMLAGSYAYSVLTNDFLDIDSDINLYTTSDELLDHFCKNYKLVKDLTNAGSQYIHLGIERYMRFEVCQKLVTIAKVTTDNLKKHLLEKLCDFDFFRNVYDFDKEELTISDLNSVINKKTKFKYTHFLAGSIFRYYVFKKRGFTFEIDESKILKDAKKIDKFCYEIVKDIDNNYDKKINCDGDFCYLCPAKFTTTPHAHIYENDHHTIFIENLE